MSVYAISDLHGCLDGYKVVKDFLKPEDKVICLGDCGDRGPRPWETIKAVAADKQWTYLMGNHEHMLAGAMCQYLNDSRLKIFEKAYDNQDMINLLGFNGGYKTLNGWIRDGADPAWITYLLELPYTATYENIILSHAGFNSVPTDNYDYLWDRTHIDIAPESNDKVIVHGHTPCVYLLDNWTPEDGTIWYANNQKVDIDMGTVSSNCICLLNLDTFDEEIFLIEHETDNF